MLFAQKNNLTDTVTYWNKNQPLTFKDFQGKPKQEDTGYHSISSKILTHKLGAIIKSINVDITTVKGKTTFTIRAAMLKVNHGLKITATLYC